MGVDIMTFLDISSRLAVKQKKHIFGHPGIDTIYIFLQKCQQSSKTSSYSRGEKKK